MVLSTNLTATVSLNRGMSLFLNLFGGGSLCSNKQGSAPLNYLQNLTCNVGLIE